MSEKELKEIAEEISNSDRYVDQIADKVYERLFKDFSRVEDYMKASNERYHSEHAKKYRLLERKVIVAGFILLLLQFLFK